MTIPIIYEDEYLLVIHKPSGISSQANADNTKSVIDLLNTNYLVVHRLDQRVSGLLVLAKTKDIQTALTTQLNNNQFIKKYKAVVGNKPNEEKAHLTHWLLKSASKSKAYKKPLAHAQKASLTYQLLQHSEKYFLLEIELQQGKFHQIRAQLAAIGSPIVGDVKYGFKRTTVDGSIFLQAYHIECIHPITKQPLQYSLPIPELWKKYGFDNK